MPESDYYDREYFHGGKGYGDYGGGDFTWIVDVVANFDGVKSILDIGCAQGYYVKALRDAGYDAHGIDISEYAIQGAPESIRPYLSRVDVASLSSMRSFDLIISNDTLEHIEEEKLSSVRVALRLMSDRFWFRVGTPDTPDWQHDASHITIKPLEWWRDWMPEATFEESK